MKGTKLEVKMKVSVPLPAELGIYLDTKGASSQRQTARSIDSSVEILAQAHPPQAPAAMYAPYVLDGQALSNDWVQHLELDGAIDLGRHMGGDPLRVLVLYGSLRERSFSKLLAFEFSRWVNDASSPKPPPPHPRRSQTPLLQVSCAH